MEEDWVVTSIYWNTKYKTIICFVLKAQNHTTVFPKKVIGSAFGPRERENTQRAYADLSSYAINKLFKPSRE